MHVTSSCYCFNLFAPGIFFLCFCPLFFRRVYISFGLKGFYLFILYNIFLQLFLVVSRLFMKNLSLIVNVFSTRLKLTFGRIFRYYSFGNSALSAISQEDVYVKFEDSISDGDGSLNHKFSLAECEEQDEVSFCGEDMAEVVNKDILFFNNQKAENCKMKGIMEILTNLGWNLTSSACRVDMNETNIIETINDLYKESMDASLALDFFNWTECCSGSMHTVKSVCRMIHILVSGNMKHRAMDMMLHLVRNYGEDKSCDLLLTDLFETHTERRVLEITCSMLVNCYIMEKMVDVALELTCQLVHLNIFPSVQVYNKLLTELVRSNEVNLALKLSEVMEERGLNLKSIIISLLIRQFCREDKVESGWKLLLDTEKNGIRHDVVSYTIIIHSLCKLSCFLEATSLLFKMTELGICPDSVLISSIIDGFCKLGDIEKAINILKVFNLPLNIFLYNSFISKSCTDGNMSKACRLFHEMSELGLLPDCVSYTTIIGGYCKVGDINKAFQYFGKMLKGGSKPSVTTFTLLIDTYGKSGNLEKAESMFQKMTAEGLQPDVVAYNTLMNGYGKKGKIHKVYELLHRMKSSNVCPDVVSYNTLIRCLVNRGFVNEAVYVLDELEQRGLRPDVVTFTNLIDGRLKQGNFEEAFLLWSCMSDNHHVEPDVVTCSALVNGYCRECRMEEARRVFQDMLKVGLNPDLRLYNILIHGFCSVGDMDEACNLVSMMIEHGILPTTITHRALALGFQNKGANNPVISAAFKLQDILLRYGIGFDVDTYLAMVVQPAASETASVSEHSLANCCKVVS